MKKILFILCAIGFISTIFARTNTFTSKPRSYSSPYGETHTVRPYIRKNGTFVPGHRSANPGSGVHCRNNVCY